MPPPPALHFVTAGFMLQALKSRGARALAGVDAVVMDEVHERSTENDLMLAQLLMLAPPDMKLVLMSARVSLRPLQMYFSQHGAGGQADELRQVGDLLAPLCFCMHLSLPLGVCGGQA